MKFKVFTLLFILCKALLLQAENPPEIRVHLSTDSALSPLYIGKIQAEQSSLDAAYLSQLEAVLQFDFGHNGETRLLPRQPAKEQLLGQKELAVALKLEEWREWGVSFVIKPTVVGKALSIALLSSQSGALKHFKDVPLCGNFSEDRKQIHRLSDAIYKALFNKEGVANSQLLYCVQMKNANSDGSGWLSEVWQCDYDGGNARQVTKEGSYCVTPVALPGSATPRFVYVSYKMGQPKIFLASVKEGVGKKLISLQGNQLLPAVSSQKDKLAFICDAGGRSDLFVQPISPESGEAGKPIQLFSYPRATQASPTFNPDGSKIAFVSDKDGGTRIYIIPSSAASKRATPYLITKQNRENSCPAWSPDGTKLAYSAKTNGVRQIWIYDFETRQERQLTDGAGNKENPAWAKDSLHLIFNSTDAESSELYLLNLNQPEAVKITKGPGKKHYPTWGT
jgi:TolB protein